MTELEKIDALRQRMRLSYSEAKQALDAADGDVIQALVNLERESRAAKEQMMGRSKQTWEELKEGVLKAGRARIRLKRGEKVLFELPAPVGALGLVGAFASTQLAVAGLVGTAVALANKCNLEIDTMDKNNQGFDNTNSSDI